MKAIFSNIRFPIKQKTSFGLLNLNKMNLFSKIRKINMEKKFSFNSILKNQSISIIPTSNSNNIKKVLDLKKLVFYFF